MSNPTRRQFAGRGILFAMALALGKLDTLKAQGGQLTCDLTQWREVVFKYRGETLRWTTKEIFEALK